jgi:hypothetical protein
MKTSIVLHHVVVVHLTLKTWVAKRLLVELIHIKMESTVLIRAEIAPSLAWAVTARHVALENIHIAKTGVIRWIQTTSFEMGILRVLRLIRSLSQFP